MPLRARRGWTHWTRRTVGDENWDRCDQVEGRYAVEGSPARRWWRVLDKSTGRIVSTGHFTRVKAIRAADQMETDRKIQEKD